MKRIVAIAMTVIIAALFVAPSAFAGDQIKDQIQLKLKDGSCATCPCDLG